MLFLLLCLSLLLHASATVATTEWSLVHLNESKWAKCIDGSPAAVYVKPGFGDDINKFVIFFEGGGWCTTIESCYFRSKTALGSSVNYSATTTSWAVRDLLDPDCAKNTAFCNWTSLYLPYCDGQSRAGDAAEPVVYEGTELWFRGFGNIVESVTAFLSKTPPLNSPSLSEATHVLVSGSSAGGLSTYLHIDMMAALIREGNANPDSLVIKAVPEVGFFIDGASIWNGQHLMTECYQRLQGFANITGGVSNQVNAACVDATPDRWKCFMAQYTYPYISTPVMPVNSKLDQWQLENILAIDPDITIEEQPWAPWTPCINDPAKDCNATQSAQFFGYADQFLAALEEAYNATPAKNLAQNGQFITSCDIHTTMIGGFSHRIMINGTTMYDAVSAWYSSLSGGPQYKWMDGSWPSNPTCPGPLDHLLIE